MCSILQRTDHLLQVAALCIDCMNAVPIITSSSMSHPAQTGFTIKIGSKASMLAVAILEFHQDSIACIFSVWAIVRRHRGGGQVEGRIITGPISSPSHSHTSRPNKKDSPPALLLRNEKWEADEYSDRLFGVFTCHLSPFGQKWTLCSLRQSTLTDDISFAAPVCAVDGWAAL